MTAPAGYNQTTLFDPFEIHLGPVFETGVKGSRRFALTVDERHVNRRGVVHGGMFMTFADLAMGQAAWDATDNAAVVTLNMQSQFLNSAHMGDLLEGAPQVTRRTRSLLFLRADFEVAGAVIFVASSVWKILGQD